MRRFTLAQPALLDPPGGDRMPATPDAARACAPRPGQGDVHLLSGAGIGDASHLGERREVDRRPERRRWGRPELIGRRQEERTHPRELRGGRWLRRLRAAEPQPRADRHGARPRKVEAVRLGSRDRLRAHLPARGLTASEVGMRLPRSRVRLLLDLVLEQLRVGRIEVSQHSGRRAGDRPAVGFELAPTARPKTVSGRWRSEEHTSELQSLAYLVCRLLLEKKKNNKSYIKYLTTR